MKKTILFLAALLLAGCMVGCFGENRHTVSSVKALFAENLKRGDSSGAVEQFLRHQGFPYTFDTFSRRYQSIVPSSRKTNVFGVERVIRILVYVDKDGNFDTAEVRMIYSWF